MSEAPAAVSKKGTVTAVKNLTEAEYGNGMADTAATVGVLANIAGAFIPNAQAISSTASNLANVKTGSTSKQIVAQELSIRLENNNEVVTKQPVKASGQRKLKKNDKVIVGFENDKVVTVALLNTTK